MRPSDYNVPWWRRLLRWRLMLPLNLLLIGFVGWSYVREWSRSTEVTDQLTRLRQEIAVLEGKNTEYSVLLGKLGTTGFLEHEARLKLGYQKPGEQVLMLRTTEGVARSDDRVNQIDAAISNPHKWWRYFFIRR